MRETLAKLVAAAITALLVLMAALFADRRNDGGEAARFVPDVSQPLGVPASPAPEPALVARGRVVYEEQACARCHAVAGAGNPRAALDGVGARRSVDELRDWVTAQGVARPQLSRTAQRAKERYGALPEADLDALVAYISSLR